MTKRDYFAGRLSHPDPVVRAAARNRLAMLAGEPEPEPEPETIAAVGSRAVPQPLRALILACPHRTTWSLCGCDGWCGIGRGNRTKSGRYYVSWEDCKACPERPQ